MPSDRPVLAHAEIRRIVIGIMLAMFLGALDQTIVATALPTIGRQFGDFANLSWVVTAYLLTATAATPLYGKLSDIHGRRTMLLIAVGVFVAGSVVCALAPSMGALIAGRALQGLGGGGLLSLAQVIVGDIVAPKERGRYQGYIGFVFAAASVSGPVLGGFFAGKLSWTLIFWINLPVGLAAFAMTYGALKRLPRHERPHRLDFIGAVLMVTAAVALLLALAWGGSRYAWGSLPILALIGVSVVLWALFALRLASAPEPFLPLSILFNKVVANGTIAATCMMGSLIGLTIFTPMFFEAVLGLSATQSGLMLIPLMLTSTLSSTASGRAMGRMVHYKRIAIGGFITAIAALTSLAVFVGHLSPLAVSLVLGVAGTGMGMVFPITTVSVQNAVRLYELGTATGTMNFFRSLGSTIAVAAFGAIILTGLAVSTTGGAGLEALVTAAAQSGVNLAGVFRWVFAASAAIMALGFVFILLMEERPLRSQMPPVSSIPAE